MTDPQLDHELDTEPALTIGQIFADKKMLKTYVAAGVSLVALAFKVVIDDAQVDNIVTVLSGLGMLVTAIMAQVEASQRAKAQAAETREHVYAPATVEKLTAGQDGGASTVSSLSVHGTNSYTLGG